MFALISRDNHILDNAGRPVFQAIFGVASTKAAAQADAAQYQDDPQAPPMEVVPCTERLADDVDIYGWHDQPVRWLEDGTLDLDDDAGRQGN